MKGKTVNFSFLIGKLHTSVSSVFQTLSSNLRIHPRGAKSNQFLIPNSSFLIEKFNPLCPPCSILHILFSPILKFKILQSFKMTGIIGHHHQIKSNGRSTNQKVKVVDNITGFAKTSFFFSINIKCRKNGQNLNTIYKIIEDRPVSLLRLTI